MSDRPPCYGDVSEYDPTHPACINCPARAGCRTVVARKKTTVHPTSTTTESRPTYGSPSYYASPGYYRSTTTTPVSSGKPDNRTVTETSHPTSSRQSADRMGFFQILATNGFLNALESVFRETVFAMGTIPRFKYHDPFERWRHKPDEDRNSR